MSKTLVGLLEILAGGSNYLLKPAKSYHDGAFTADSVKYWKGSFKGAHPQGKNGSINISYAIPGYVEIPSNLAKPNGLDEKFKCSAFKVVNLERGGKLEVDEILVELDSATQAKIKGQFTVKQLEGNIFKISLKGIPVYAGGSIGTPVEIAKLVSSLNELKAESKAVEHTLANLVGNKQGKFAKLSPDAISVLVSNRISSSFFYQPEYKPGAKEESAIGKFVDYYLSGFSTIPSVNAVLKKTQAGKSCTEPEKLVDKYLTKYGKASAASAETAVKTVKASTEKVNARLGGFILAQLVDGKLPVGYSKEKDLTYSTPSGILVVKTNLVA